MLERVLLALDVGLPGAIFRVALGVAWVIALRLLAPGAGLLGAAASLAAVLFGLKALTAIARRLLPATPTVRAQWEWRRNLARNYDSYQWRKLVWFGVGILAAAVAASTQRGVWEVRLGLACILSGALGEVAWRRNRPAALPSGRA